MVIYSGQHYIEKMEAMNYTNKNEKTISNNILNQMENKNLIRASIVVMSHLSDVQEMVDHFSKKIINARIMFAKFVINQCEGDLRKEIDPEKMFNDYLTKFGGDDKVES